MQYATSRGDGERRPAARTRRPRAAGPNAAKTPAPIIEPSPMTTASPRPSRRASRLGAPLTSLVVLHELDLERRPLLEERRVHAGEVAPVGRLAGLHARLDQALVRAVHVVGTEAEVPEVDLRIVGAAQLDLQPRRRVGDDARRSRCGLRRPCRTALAKRSTCASRSGTVSAMWSMPGVIIPLTMRPPVGTARRGSPRGRRRELVRRRDRSRPRCGTEPPPR